MTVCGEGLTPLAGSGKAWAIGVRNAGRTPRKHARGPDDCGQSDHQALIVRPGQIDHLEELIADLATVAPADAAALTTRLATVVASNDEWTARRQAWESRPRPFPAAGMTSRDLEATMVALLEDRGWNVERLVITDGDWWVQRGEFRYLATAALSGDDQGPFWSAVSFRQDATLAGYGPLHIWKVGDKVRLP